MDIKELFSFLQSYYKKLLALGVAFSLIGALSYYVLPLKYYASGSLFIHRSVNPFTEEHFTYECYYGQQAAMSYTNSVIGLIESEDIRYQTLKKLKISVNEKTLRKYARKIQVKKAGPQLITLIIKEDSPEKAHNLWEAVAESTIETTERINSEGDPLVGITTVQEMPFVRESFRNLWINTLIGFSLGVVFSLFYFGAVNYLKSGKK